jgi:hypothetical protein
MATPAEVQALLFLTPNDPQILRATNLPDSTNVDYYVSSGVGLGGRNQWISQAIATAAATQASNIRAALIAYR